MSQQQPNQTNLTHLLTPPSSANNDEHIQEKEDEPSNHNETMSMIHSGLSTFSLPSSASGSTCSQTRQEDKIFDQIEDMLCEYMRDPLRHYLQFRILRWAHEGDPSKVFTAIVVINPPMDDAATEH